MITSSVEAESVANFFGRTKGTSAPNFFDIFAISLFSVETITELKIFESSAFYIVYAKSGLPANFLIFFFGTPLDPPLAAIKQIGFMKKSNI